ncbi:DUF2147 domain-containing protein [Flavobacterium jejuense]|uniref:DUF2147 domain-containing protein n=1 Tax=Flavobacterium jejuense TaxID=1544455 RepID=A0ABX0IUS0_9FLAO|nr:DUF2147 domain-containing protein [Flavobacterium jejuense]NHN27306.1 DUF2147 domain-containing protein [Flavobacterium jejuense]
MKKRRYFIIITTILLIVTVIMAQTPDIDKDFKDSDKIIGTWVSKAKDSRMEIYKSNDSYKGRLIEGWGLELYEDDGVTLTQDSKNPDKSLRDRTLKNMEFISEMTFEKGAYKGGEIYMAKLGKSMKCKMYFKGEELRVRIYVGIPILGTTKKWTRVQ